MEQEIKLYFFIKVSLFIFFTWICHFSNNISIFDKFLYGKRTSGSKLDIRNYRLLAKYRHDKYSNFLNSKEEIPNYMMKKEKDICINDKGDIRKMNQSDAHSLNNTGGYKLHKKNKSNIFETIKLSHIEKIIFKELDYIDFVKKNRTISDETYKKIIRKKLALRITIPLLLFLLLSVSMIIDFSCFHYFRKGVFYALRLWLGGWWYGSLNSLLEKSSLNFLFKSAKQIKLNRWTSEGTKLADIEKYDYVYGFYRYLLCLIYLIAFLILGVTLILGMVYYHKKVKKYQKIKFRKR
ncbi:fam-l protein [Plasmodium brasilianum]|uniref:Fam-l protein n=1 Tax=Plasmodium brasilianum TaxID=5824 RepID=A0ACB9YEP6_PLABR|nr:fam-l protein [Plasmodium brasilianum]